MLQYGQMRASSGIERPQFGHRLPVSAAFTWPGVPADKVSGSEKKDTISSILAIRIITIPINIITVTAPIRYNKPVVLKR